MASCLTAPCHYMNQYRLIIIEIKCFSTEGSFTRNVFILDMSLKIMNLRLQLYIAGTNESISTVPLQWRNSERNGVLNHRRLHCCSSVGSGADQRKHQSSASLAFVRGIHRWPANSPHKRPITRKMFSFHDVIMHPKKQPDGSRLVVFCCGLLTVSFTLNLQDCYTGDEAILRLTRCPCQCSPKSMGELISREFNRNPQSIRPISQFP